ELLSLYDEAYRPLWPARVDLVVRSYVSDNFFLTAFLFASIEQMWPAGIGDVILVLDESDRHVEDIVPPWVKIYYEKNFLDLPGKILQQWSYLWADNYTTAPYIAIIDDDVIFNLKVTPGLLFNLTNGKPYVIGSKNTQSDNWKPSSYYFVGRYHANYMVQLPFVFPRSVLPGFRRRAAKRHKKDFNAAVKYFADHGPSFAKTQIAHTTLGNYMWFFANDSVHWVLEWTPVTPLPRVDGFSDVEGSSEKSSGGMRVGIESQIDPCGGIGSSPGNDNCFGSCKRRTKSGHCVKELFKLYDDAYKPLWPARVDLLIRSYVSDTFFLLEMLFDSIEQMWPRGIGDVILVLDEDNQIVEDIVPTWIKVYYEKNYLKLPGKILQQWSYLWADNYTTAPYIAIIDDDVIFNLKVTPGLLFNLTDGKPYVIGSRQKQMNHWVPSTHYFVGKPYYFANFMVQLPFVFPRDVLPKFRDHVTRIRDGKFASFDDAFLNFARHGPKFERTQIAHTTLGNFMWAFTQDEVHWALDWTNHVPKYPTLLLMLPSSPLDPLSPRSPLPPPLLSPIPPFPNPQVHWSEPTTCPSHMWVCTYPTLFTMLPLTPQLLTSSPPPPHLQVHWALEWTNHVPIPRVGVHMSYSQPFRTATNNSDTAPRVVKIYVALAGYYAHEALCHAFPKGALDRCGDVLKYEQRQIWQYVMDWYDWPAIKHKRRNATFVYDLYKQELACMYGKVVDARTNEWTDHILGRRMELVNEMTKDCATPHSN
ncbi:unnamed protein product, partial [Closterium sp. NIES-53]